MTSKKIIGEYEIYLDNIIGTGSFSTVYKGMNTKTGKILAIKEINLKNIRKNNDDEINEKIMRNLSLEIKTMQLLKNCNILSMEDLLIKENYIYMMLEYCDGGDLTKYIRHYPKKNRITMEEKDVKVIAKQIMNGLKYMHSLGIVHRDLKPQNILIKSEGDNKIIKIADFGFARFLKDTQTAETICGSPLYMSPEILKCQRYSDNTDIWSFGIILYEMLMGNVPYFVRSLVELSKIYSNIEKIDIPKEIQVSDNCKDLIIHMLTVNPQNRITWDELFQHKWFDDTAIIKCKKISNLIMPSNICGSAPSRIQKTYDTEMTDSRMIQSFEIINITERRSDSLKQYNINIKFTDALYDSRCWIEKCKLLICIAENDCHIKYYISSFKICKYCLELIDSVRNTFKNIVKNMSDDYCDEISLIIIQFNKLEKHCEDIKTTSQKYMRQSDTCKPIDKLIFDKAITFGNRGKVYLDIERYDVAFEDFVNAKYLLETLIPIVDDRVYINQKISIYTQYLELLQQKI
jgi:serine/threonine-protein kinase ULK/ATG1